MKRLLIAFVVVGFLSDFVIPQNNNYPEKFGKLQSVKRELIYNRVIVEQVEGDSKMGFLQGLKDDSLVILRNALQILIPISNISSLRIEKQKNNWESTAFGGILGSYSIIYGIFREEREPDYYIQAKSKIIAGLFSFIGLTAGAGLGYLIDKILEEEYEIFFFAEDPEQQLSEQNRLKEYLLNSETNHKFHIMINTMSVFSRRDEAENPLFGKDVFYLNLFRSIHLNYSLNNKFRIGVVIYNLGEPTIYTSVSKSDDSQSTHATYYELYSGVGYYTEAIYLPFAGLSNFLSKLEIIAGVGFAKVQYNSSFYFTQYTPRPVEEYYSESTIDHGYFSYFLSANYNIKILDRLSLGITIDYVHIPVKRNAVPKVNLERRSLGNFGIGISTNFHF